MAHDTASLNRVCARIALCFGAVFSVVARQMGGAKTIAVNQTCIKVVATLRPMLMHDAAAAVAAEKCFCIARTTQRTRASSTREIAGTSQVFHLANSKTHDT